MRLPSRHSVLIAVVAAVAVVACGTDPSDSVVVEGAAAAPATPDNMESILGSGFVVWESNRSGSWRLWMRDLDGGSARQLTPDEGPRLHCCPHISPDGRWIAYLSLDADQQGYPQGGAHGALRLIQPDGTGDRLLLPDARNYYENRAVVWRSAKELIFIGLDRRTALLDLETAEITTLTKQPAEAYPWLIDSGLRFATSGRVSFAPYDTSRREVLERSSLGGCQPYFTHDGKWGFWVAAPGGPIQKIDLATDAKEPLLKKSDPRLPREFGYLYFPMISADGRALAFAASRNEHPHFAADYEVFAVPTNPATLQVLGSPVRITEDPATDRYPDIYLEPMELGLFRGEAPLTVRVTPPGEPRLRQWNWGDGTRSEGETAEHTYDRPGHFVISATAAGTELIGRAIVDSPQPPRLTKIQVTGSGHAVTLHFDEPIQIEDATWALESGVSVTSVEQIDDDRGLLLRLNQPLISVDRLNVEGVQDRASPANAMQRISLDLIPTAWPVDREGLLLVWETGDAANLVLAEDGEVEQSVILESHGAARLDHDWALRPNGGRFSVPKELANRIRWACQATYELTVEAIVEPQPAERRTGVILGMARGQQNFLLSQAGDDLVMSIRVKSRGPDAAPEVRLTALPPGEKSHIAVTYSPGRLVAYLNGEQVLSTSEIQGGFFHWQTLPVTIGNDAGGHAPWHGSLEGLAIYDRELSAEEVQENAARQRQRLDARQQVPQWTLRVEREGCSAIPTLEEIAPYREALAVCDYRVMEALEGEYDHPSARVAHWVIQDGQRVPLRPIEDNAGGRIVVERFMDNPQLESLYLSDTLPTAPDLPLMYLVRESRRH